MMKRLLSERGRAGSRKTLGPLTTPAAVPTTYCDSLPHAGDLHNLRMGS